MIINAGGKKKEVFKQDIILLERDKHWYIVEYFDVYHLVIIDAYGDWDISNIYIFPFLDCDYLEFLEANIVERL